MPQYLSLSDFRNLTLAPTNVVDSVEAKSPGWIDKQLEHWSKYIDARLIKRYDVPCVLPYPLVVLDWLQRIVTIRVFLKRGVDANDLQWQTVKTDCDAALAELAEAATGDTGKFELPKRADNDASGVTKEGPFGYSEQSPYVWMDAQLEAAVREDENRSGTRS